MQVYWFIILSVYCEANVIPVYQENHPAHFGDGWEVTGDCPEMSWTPSSQLPGNKIWGTCFPGNNNVQNCSLTSENWELNKRVNTIFVNIKGGGHKCSDFNKIRCIDNFILKILYGQNTAYDISIIPPNNESMVDSTTNPKFYKYHAILPINVVGMSRFRFIFQSSYFCGDIDGIKVVYYECPQISELLVEFKSHVAPTPSMSPLNINGKCIEHSVSLNSNKEPSMLCYYNGTYKVSGECHCNKGFQKTEKNECEGISNFIFLSLFLCFIFIINF